MKVTYKSTTYPYLIGRLTLGEAVVLCEHTGGSPRQYVETMAKIGDMFEAGPDKVDDTPSLPQLVRAIQFCVWLVRTRAGETCHPSEVDCDFLGGEFTLEAEPQDVDTGNDAAVPTRAGDGGGTSSEPDGSPPSAGSTPSAPASSTGPALPTSPN